MSTLTSRSEKDLFIIDEGITYLNCASMSPMLKTVKAAGLQALETCTSPWKISSEDWFINGEKLRGLVAKIFQSSPDNISFIPSASYGLATAAKNLKLQAGKEIIILEQQFPSNYYVWENLAQQYNLKIVTIARSTDKQLTESILEKINKNTGLVAIPNCHWIDGAWIDLKKISDAVKTVNSYFVLDLSQSLGALPIDIEDIQPDFAVSVGYKWLLGPYSLGYMYVAKKWHDKGEPLEYSWMTRKGSEDFTSLTSYETDYRTGARKFDMGEFSNFNLLPMAIAALEQIIQWKVSIIQVTISNLNKSIIDYKNKILTSDLKFTSVGHITSIPLGNLNVNTLKDRLKYNNVFVSFRGTSIRIAPHLYNNQADIAKLLACLQE